MKKLPDRNKFKRTPSHRRLGDQEPDVGCTKIYYPKLLKAEFKKLIPFLHEGQDREQKPLSMLRGIHLQDLIFYLGTITKNYMLCSEG